VICVLTDDPKFDVPLPEVGRRLPDLAYIGAMGSRRTHGDLMQRVRGAGLCDQQLARHSSPIGLDLGGPSSRGDGRLHRRREHRHGLGWGRWTPEPDRWPHPPRAASGLRSA
jgi:XdhC Rossmann domain